MGLREMFTVSPTLLASAGKSANRSKPGGEGRWPASIAEQEKGYSAWSPAPHPPPQGLTDQL